MSPLAIIRAAAAVNDAERDYEGTELPVTYARLMPMGSRPLTIAHLTGIGLAWWLCDLSTGGWRGVGSVMQ